jgi:hypothetical protein
VPPALPFAVAALLLVLLLLGLIACCTSSCTSRWHLQAHQSWYNTTERQRTAHEHMMCSINLQHAAVQLQDRSSFAHQSSSPQVLLMPLRINTVSAVIAA